MAFSRKAINNLRPNVIHVKSYLGVIEMKKKLILLGIMLGMFFSAGAVSADDYPNIASKYDVNNMSQYSDSDLDQYVTMKNFYVQGISYDKHHHERIVFTNTPQSKDYYFTVLQGNKHHKRLAVGDSVTIKGSVGPRQTLEKTQANKFFSKSLIGKNMIFVLTDSYK